MGRFDDERFRKILDDEGKRHEQKRLKREPIRQRLEQGARDAIVQYERECVERRPEGQERIEQTIQPWADQLVESKLYEKLRARHQRSFHVASVSDSIYYFWPRNAFRDLKERRPFAFIAELIQREHPDDIDEGFDDRGWQAGIDEVWRADFFIDSSGLRVSRWPTIGGGFGFAVVAAKDYEIPVPIDNVKATVGAIHPDVLIEFSEQIEGGRAQHALEGSLKPKRLVIGEPGEWQQRQWEAREKFLKRRKGR